MLLLARHTSIILHSIILQTILYKTQFAHWLRMSEKRTPGVRGAQMAWSPRWAGGTLKPGVAALTCFLVLSLPGHAFPPQAKNAREIAQRAFPSVVLLVMEDKHGNPLSLGSGFFVRDGVIATNMHVIVGAEKGHAKLIGQKTEYEVRGIVGRDPVHDLVLLAVDDTRVPPLGLGENRDVGVGDEVYAIGNPLGLEGTFSQGIVSGMRHIGPDTLLQITAPISPGSSGGPVLDSRGVAIGVAVATFDGGQNLNFAIPVSYLASLLSHPSPMAPLSANIRTSQQESITGALGGRDSKAVVGSQFAWDASGPLLVNYFSFSLQNKLREPVTQVDYLVVFYGRSGNPVETYNATWTGEILPGLAKREVGSVEDESVRNLTARVEIRVLDFKLASERDKAVDIPQSPQPATKKIEADLSSLPKYWVNVESGDTETVRVENEYLYEEGTFQGDGKYIKEIRYICELKRQGDQWMGKCHNRYLLLWGSLVSETWCSLDLDEVITSVSRSRIEGEAQDFGYPSRIEQCPVPSSNRGHWSLIPKD